jgi:hypothetical protein
MWAYGEERRRRSFAAVCESLEGRALLSTAALDLPKPANHAAEVGGIHAAAKSSKHVVTLHGKVTGVIESIQSDIPLSVNTVIEATGTTTGLPGTVVFEASQQTVENTAKTHVTVTNGTGFITPLSAQFGSQIVVSYKGSGPVVKKAVKQTLQVHGTVTGGTGAYAGSSGTFSGVATVNLNTGAFSLKFTLMVKPIP